MVSTFYEKVKEMNPGRRNVISIRYHAASRIYSVAPSSYTRLLGIIRGPWWGIIYLNAATLLVIRVVEGQTPATLTLGSAEPQAQQVAAGCRRRVVLVGSTGVQNVLVGQKLDVANLEDHVQRETQARVLEYLYGLLLGLGKRGNEALVRETGERADVVRVPPVIDVSYSASEG